MAMSQKKPAQKNSHGRAAERRRSRAVNPDWIEHLVAIGSRVPDSELKRLPDDLAKNFDHYAHGSPRQD
jgi:hypothetical protein